MRPTSARTTRAALGLITAATVLLAAAVPAVAAPGPAALAPIRVDAQVGNDCLEVRAPRKQTTVRLTQKRDGSTIRTRSGSTDNQRRIVFCVSKLRIGDKLVITQSGTTRTLSVPTLEVKAKLNDTVTGRVPAAQPAFDLLVNLALAGDAYGGYPFDDEQANEDGTFSVDVSHWSDYPIGGINGSDSAMLTWVSARGDTWLAITPVTRAFRVEAGKSVATIVDQVGRTVTLTLRNAGGDVRGTATATLTNDTKQVTFRDDGDPVTVQVGDRVRTSRSSLELEVIDPGLILDPGPPGGYISFTCHPDSMWTATISLDGAPVHRWGGYSESGEVSFVDVTAGNEDASGHLAVVDCESPNGFVQRFRGTFA